MADEEAAKTGVAPTGETPPAKPMSANDLMTMANNYHVPMSQGTLQSIVGDTPEVSPEKATAFEGYVKTTAAGLYPTLAPQINAGIPTSFLLDPYRQIGKQVLGDDYEPNFQTDTHDRAALQGGTPDPKTGRPSSMTLDEWKAHLKTDPKYGYASTLNGQYESALMKQKIAQAFEGATSGN